MAAADIKLPPGVEIRIAKMEDYEEVMDIDRNIYDGMDYLPKKYMEYIKDPNRLCLVVKNYGRIVGFQMFYIVDEGKTRVGQAGRVHSDFQGRKYSTYVEVVAQQLIARSHNIQQLMWTSINRKANDVVVKKHEDTNYVVIRPRFSLDFAPLQLEFALKKPEFRELQKMSQKYSTLTLTPSSVKEVMTSFPQDVTAMLPEGFWVVNWEPFQPMAGNYDLITKDATVFVTVTTDGSLLAVSYGTSVEVKAGLRHRADYYCRPEQANNKDLFVAHLTRHLVHVHQFYRGSNISFSILYPKNVERMASNVKQWIEGNLDLHLGRSSEADCLLLMKQTNQEVPASKL